MMASIFFTERLPGTSISKTAGLFPRCAWSECCSTVCPGEQPGTRQLPLRTIIQSRLPQKQGLCQVAKTPDFKMFSDFYQVFAGGQPKGPTCFRPIHTAN